MKPEQIFPTILIAIDLCAMGVYWWHGNIRMTIYWLAASALTACVTF